MTGAVAPVTPVPLESPFPTDCPSHACAPLAHNSRTTERPSISLPPAGFKTWRLLKYDVILLSGPRCGASLMDARGSSDGAPRLDPAGRTFEWDTTAALLRSVRAGDSAALERLCARYLPQMRSWATGRLPLWARDALDTDDLVQDTLINTLRHLDHFEIRREGALQWYLREALRNRIREEIRRASARPKVTELGAAQADPGPSPLEQAVGNEMLRRYESALQQLNEDEREAVMLRIELGHTYAEIATATGKPSADAARMAVQRAVAKLAREMGDD